MWNKNGVTGEFTGVRGGAGTDKSFFTGADDKDGTNAKFFAQADGNIFHASIGAALKVQNSVADFNDNSSAPTLTNTWKTSASVVGASQTSTEERKKIRLKYLHRFGISKILVKSFIRRTVGGQATQGSTGVLEIAIPSVVSDTAATFSATFEEKTIELDVSTLTDGTFYNLEVILKASVTSSSGASGTDTSDCTANLREDILIQTAT